MRKVVIETVARGPTGRVLIIPSLPAGEDYEFIWRSASSVRWDPAVRSLYVLDINGFDAVDDIRQIVAAVKDEYGDDLIIGTGTLISGLEESVQQQILRELREGDAA